MLNILVLCTGNSCRSVIGEALFNHLGQGRIKAFSAGSHPKGQVHPKALATLQAQGVSTEGLFSKSWDSLENQPIDIVITVCDNAAGEVCPVYLNQAVKAHWGLPDPDRVTGSNDEVMAAFKETYRALEQRINKMLALPLETMPADELTAELNAIGKLTA
ncbi:arsenate reductase ArsC [Methylobacter marinus]|uniref:arsenate reductase ArsC n=1 Tax=Methylobacter marinus TaxID=34058 RepID=UPI0003669303|nr:arsenate reductase ArsC [Methylobacter marinus]